MTQIPTPSPLGLFKGIALFTPGGDLIYCIDPQKRNRWHLQLCTALQGLLGLSERPHFLVPCYTATVDRWWDVQTQTVQTAAEACPRVMKYAGLLNAVFGLQGLQWTPKVCPEEHCDPELLDNYRTQFPELWDYHNLVARFQDVAESYSPAQHHSNKAHSNHSHTSQPPANEIPEPEIKEFQGFVLRLFVSGRSASVEPTLRKLHHALETSLKEPYTLKVVDVYRNPEQAEEDQITATPTLLKVWPPPSKRIVGNLDDMEQLLNILTLHHR